MTELTWKRSLAFLLSALGPILFVATVVATRADPNHLISQNGKRFGPQEVSLRTGEHITIFNDDANFVHHAYVDTEDFAYDSGDIEPGARAVIAFPHVGDFTVLCGVHPKMKLAVRVE